MYIALCIAQYDDCAGAYYTLCIIIAYAVNFVRNRMHIMSAVNLALGIVTCKVCAYCSDCEHMTGAHLAHVVYFTNGAGYYQSYYSTYMLSHKD